MNQKVKIFTSALLTALVIVTVLAVNLFNRAGAQTNPSAEQLALPALPTPAANAETYTAQIEAYQAQINAVEAGYKTQINTLTSALTQLDAENTPRLQAAQQQLTVADATLTGLNADVETAQTHLNQLQQALQTTDAAYYQEQLNTLLAQAQQNEASLQAQIEQTYTQLQAAYDEIALQQALASSNSGGGDNNNGGSNDDGDDDDEHHEDEHENDHDDGEHDNDD